MQKNRILGLLLLFQLAFSLVWGCNDDANPEPDTLSQDIQTGGEAGTPVPASSGGQGAVGVDNEILETAGNGTSEASAGSGSATAGRATAGVDTTEPAAAGTSAADGDTTTAAAGNGGQTTDSGDTTTPVDVEIPEPVTTPYVWGVGIGITDIPAAVQFYTEVMAMTVEASDVVRDDRTETVLYASEADRGSRLVLMNFNDGRNTQKVTAKLVWFAANPSSVSLAAAGSPDYVSRLNMGAVVQFDGPETYIHEVVNLFDTGGAGIDVPYVIAIGFSVSDLPASRAFYTTAFGMAESSTGTFPVVDATGSGTITEYTVQYSTGGGAGFVLQSWVPARNSTDNPVKVVLFVPDAQAAADSVVAAGGTVLKEAERTPVYENRKLIVAKDLDGYIIELVE